MRYPWSADRELTLEMVTLEVFTQFPELRPVRARYVGSGWDCDAYLVNEEWLFRFPRRRDVVVTLEREIAVLARLPELSGVRTPRQAKSGRLVGIIDWEDASIGDPAFDFVGLRYWLGADFVANVLQRYSVVVDQDFRERLEFLARLRTLDDLGNALLKEGPHRSGKHVAWLRTAFSA